MGHPLSFSLPALQGESDHAFACRDFFVLQSSQKLRSSLPLAVQKSHDISSNC